MPEGQFGFSEHFRSFHRLLQENDGRVSQMGHDQCLPQLSNLFSALIIPFGAM